MFDVTEIQSFLDELDDVKRRLAGESRDQIDVTELSEISLVLGEILGWDTAYTEMAKRLGIAASTLTKFVKMRGKVKVQTAKAVTERLRTFLRSLDHATPQKSRPIRRELVSQPQFSFSGEKWIEIARPSDLSLKIAAIANLLNNIIEQVNRTNLPDDEQALSAIERHQLVAILETALNVLKSPLVEKGLLRRAQEGLKKASGRAVEKEVQQGLGKLAASAAAKISEILASLL